MDMEEMLLAGLQNTAAGLPGQAANIGMNALSNYINIRMTENSQKRMTNWYMDQYGSPEARMRMMEEAGINPFAAAAGIAGSGGVSGSGAPHGGVASNNIGTVSEAGAEAAASALNMATAYNTGLQSYFDAYSMNDRLAMTHSQAVSAYAQSWEDMYRAEHFPEFYDATIESIRVQAYTGRALKNMYDAQAYMYTQQAYMVSYQIDELIARKDLAASETDLNNIAYNIKQLEFTLTYLAVCKNKVELERYIKYGDVSPLVQKYIEIYDNEGEEVANEYLEKNNKVAKEQNKAQFEGKVEAEKGHNGHVGQTVDAVERLVGFNFGDSARNVLNDFLSGFGYYVTKDFEVNKLDNKTKNNNPKVSGDSSLWDKTKMSYDDWSRNEKKNIRDLRTLNQNNLRNGLITKEQYISNEDIIKGFESLITEDEYKKIWDKKE